MDTYKTIDYQNYSILLVDDDLDYLETTARSLRLRGFNLRYASSGKDSLEIIQEGKTDIMIIDCFMPEMSGETTVEEIRKFDPALVVLMQTGFIGDKPAVDMLQKLEVQGYNDKSNGLEGLIVWIIACMRTCQQQRQIRKLYSDVSVANITVNELKKEQMLLIEETRLATLGQLINGIPSMLTHYSKQVVGELFNLSKNMEYYTHNFNNLCLEYPPEKLQNTASKFSLDSITSIKGNIQNVENIINFIEETDSAYPKMFGYANRIIYKDFVVKFASLIKSELSQTYNCNLNFIEKSFIEIDKYQFRSDVYTILQVLQTLTLECAKLIAQKPSKIKYANKKYSECFGPRRTTINFSMKDVGNPNRTRCTVEFLIAIPNTEMSEEVKQKILNNSISGSLELGIFTGQLILKEKFNGDISCVEVENDSFYGGVLFRVSIPANRNSMKKVNEETCL